MESITIYRCERIFEECSELLNSNLSKKLTLLVTLKGRHDFTERMVKYLHDTQYPFHVLFADGSLEDTTEKFFESVGPLNFSFEYIRYPKDKTLVDFYKKCKDASLEVKTPYVMMADNDDFPIVAGQIKAIEFLENHPDYVGFRGRVPGLYTSNPSEPYAKHCYFTPYYCCSFYLNDKLDFDDPLLRLRSYFKNFSEAYYSVLTAATLKKGMTEIYTHNFKSLHVHETALSCFYLSCGKIKTSNTVTYIRQKFSSTMGANEKPWIESIFYVDLISEIKTTIQILVKSFPKKHRTSSYEKLLDAYICSIKEKHSNTKSAILKKLGRFIVCKGPYVIFLKFLFKLLPQSCCSLSMLGHTKK